MHHAWRGKRFRGMSGRFFGPGEVRLALLSLLAEGEKHGYQLMGELEERSGGVYRASAGTIYPTLAQLEDEGMATSESRDGKRVYQLTQAGREEVEREADAIRRIWRRGEDWEGLGAVDPDAAEVVRPALRLARLAFRVAARAQGDPEVVDEIRRILHEARDRISGLQRRER